jgi:hypothetical protein
MKLRLVELRLIGEGVRRLMRMGLRNAVLPGGNRVFRLFLVLGGRGSIEPVHSACDVPGGRRRLGF